MRRQFSRTLGIPSNSLLLPFALATTAPDLWCLDHWASTYDFALERSDRIHVILRHDYRGECV